MFPVAAPPTLIDPLLLLVDVPVVKLPVIPYVVPAAFVSVIGPLAPVPEFPVVKLPFTTTAVPAPAVTVMFPDAAPPWPVVMVLLIVMSPAVAAPKKMLPLAAEAELPVVSGPAMA
jgi:hypothetical protein